MAVPSLQRVASACALALLLIPACHAIPVNANVDLTIGGYVQGRFTDTVASGTADVPSNFDARRTYLNFAARISPKISANVMMTGFPSVGVLEAYGEYAEKDYKARLGLNRTPYGYEAGLSSASLITLERSQAISQLMYNDFAFDRGLYMYYQPRTTSGTPKQTVNAALAITNGTPMVNGLAGPAADANARKNVTARVSYPVKGGEIGASVYNGTTGGMSPGVDETRRFRYGLDAKATLGESVTAISELIYGRDGDVRKSGGYLTLAYRRPNSTIEPYARFDTFDPDRAVTGNTFNRTTVGVSKYLAPRTSRLTKFTLQYEFINDKLAPALDGRFTAQYQVVF